jgi:diaminohydroxyphosphoribosylaminopyrimidine deaminase/5-amino-6-(5-phosphoribosylamino)uracil reductase
LSSSLTSACFAQQALASARRGAGLVEPNPMVGAVVATPDGTLVGTGCHERFGGPHAEVNALAAAGPAARGGTLFVTLEPCCHHGKTPPCTDAILAAGIARVVVAAADPYPEVAGRGIALLRAAGVTVDTGLLECEASRLIAPFTKLVTTGQPWVIAKWAMSLDGHVSAPASAGDRWISSEESRRLVHDLRGRCDAILIGIGTALADDPLLTPQPAHPAGPRLVMLAMSRRGYANLSHWITLCRRRAPKGQYRAEMGDRAEMGEEAAAAADHTTPFQPPGATMTIGLVEGGTAVNILARRCTLAKVATGTDLGCERAYSGSKAGFSRHPLPAAPPDYDDFCG